MPNEQPEQFQAPPGWEVPRYTTFPLPDPSPKPTIPKPVLPGHGSPAKPYFDSPTPFLKKAQAANIDLGLKSVKWMQKANPWVNGFQIGWELGDYLYPEGAWPIIEALGGEPDESAGPGGWVPAPVAGTGAWVDACSPKNASCLGNHVGFWVPVLPEEVWCVFGPPTFPDCPNPDSWAVGDLTLFASPWEAAASSANRPLIAVSEVPAGSSAGTGARNLAFQGSMNAASPDNWEQVFVPGTGTVLAPLAPPMPSDAPMAFPLEWPMEMPTATPWPDAAPAPGTQAPPRRVVTTPAIPLAPFPVVVVNPPTPALPPPVQVIVVPAPGGTGTPTGPVTIHTKPFGGNKPPKRKTKEKKLSVRSKANKAWIVLNLATEVFDFIDALFKGLPEHIRKQIEATIDYGKEGGGKADPYAKLKAIWDNWEHMDWDAAMTAFINNQIEDMVVGGIGAAATHANKASGAATGGGGAVIGRPSGTAADAQEAAGQQPDQLPIPTVAYNAETGRWEVTVPLDKAGLGNALTFT